MPGPMTSSPDRETVPAEIRMTVTLIDTRGRTPEPIAAPRVRGVRGTTLATREIVVSGRLGIDDPGATRK